MVVVKDDSASGSGSAGAKGKGKGKEGESVRCEHLLLRSHLRYAQLVGSRGCTTQRMCG